MTLTDAEADMATEAQQSLSEFGCDAGQAFQRAVRNEDFDALTLVDIEEARDEVDQMQASLAQAMAALEDLLRSLKKSPKGEAL